MANEEVRTSTSYNMENNTKMFTLNPNSKRCYLCLNEKLKIATYRGNNLLNKKTELISKCRHQNKYTLSKYDTKDWRQFIIRNYYIVTFRLLIIFGWRLLGSHQHETPSTEPKLYLLEKLVICNFKEKDRLINKWLDIVKM